MTQAATKVLTAHVPLPLADKVDHIATRLDHEGSAPRLDRTGGGA